MAILILILLLLGAVVYVNPVLDECEDVYILHYYNIRRERKEKIFRKDVH